jgi:hypothetical protein
MSFDLPDGVAADWLSSIDALTNNFVAKNSHLLKDDAATAAVRAALRVDVHAAAVRLTELRTRHESIASDARRLLAARVAPCAALQRVQTLALGRRYDALCAHSASILARIKASNNDDECIAMCESLHRAANLVERCEALASRAPHLCALLRQRSDDAFATRRTIHTTACRKQLRLLGWYSGAGVAASTTDSAALTHHMNALDRLQALTSPSVRDGRWSLDALLEPVRQRFLFHFDGDRPTNRNDKPEWVFAHVRTLLQDHHEFVVRLLVTEHWIAALVQLAVDRCARTLVELPVAGSGGALLRHVVTETLAFESELARIHNYPPNDNDDDAWPLPSDAIASEAPPRYGGAMQWHALEHDDVVASWEAVIDVVRPEALRDAPAVLMQSVAPSATRATQLSSRSRRIALLNETLVRGAATARTTLHASGFARCDAGDVRGATCALDAAERLATVLNDTAATPLLMNTAPELLADELAALGGTRQSLLVAVVQQFLLTPCARAIAPLLRTPTNSADATTLSTTMALALSDLQRDLDVVRSVCVSPATLRAIVLELCGALDAYIFDTLWATQPSLPAPQQLGVDLGALLRLLDAFTAPLPSRNFLRKVHDLSALFSLSATERKHLRDIISRADEALVLNELRAVHANTLCNDLPKLLIILKWQK